MLHEAVEREQREQQMQQEQMQMVLQSSGFGARSARRRC